MSRATATDNQINQLETEKKALVQRIARLRKREKLLESYAQKLQAENNQLKDILNGYMKLATGLCFMFTTR
ncbi:MAG TPA: hypothetical protein DD734_03470 [Firmicutes bacterium]|nr:hypothetical protein [Bacillota bacterium]